MIGYERRDDVAVLTIDNPPVNALGPGVLDGIVDAVARATSDPAVRAVVLVGAGRTFVAGADIHIFTTLKTRDQSLARSAAFHEGLRQIEDASKPVIAAIHGHALGGGLELAMACHGRIAAASAEVGQPEVLLGLIPGAGGTQRLPRLAGVTLALEMCTSGTPISAAKALEAGILDQVVDGDRALLLDHAVALARDHASTGRIRRTRDETATLADLPAGLAACDRWRARLAKAPTPVLAPAAAVNAIEAACMLAFDAGSLVERELFADCLVSTESRALVHLFFAEREAAKVPGVPKGTAARDVRRIGVVGAGTMGCGIATTCANAGLPVLLTDRDEATLARAMGSIRRRCESRVATGKMTSAERERTLSLITPTTSFDGFHALDVVVEAVFEDMALKKATFAELGRVTRPDCLLASNTSTLDVDELAGASGRGPSVLGLHFFNPATVMKLVEIVRAGETSPASIATAQKFAKRLGKIGVVVGNGFGFVANRMQSYYMREAYLLLEEGACVLQIDHALTAFGMPVGPFAMQDLAGIDVGARIRQHLRATGGTRADGPQSDLPDRLFELGRYGQKTAAGWYRYAAGSHTPVVDPLIETLAEEAAARRGVTRRVVTDEEIVARVTTALANEGARVLEEGTASRASDIDVIFANGFGFPRYRGGPMFYADTLGLSVVLARVRDYRRRYGDYWKPAPMLEHLVADGRGFYAPEP